MDTTADQLLTLIAAYTVAVVADTLKVAEDIASELASGRDTDEFNDKNGGYADMIANPERIMTLAVDISTLYATR